MLTKSKLLSAIIMGSDHRLYIDIKLFDHTYKALLDSGATKECVGNQAAEYVIQNQLLKKCKGVVTTADGSSNLVVGKFCWDLPYSNIVRKFEFYVTPTLKQDVYLGSDFWQTFGLFDSLLQPKTSHKISEFDTGKINDNKIESNVHILYQDQREKLGLIIETFPSYEKDGLGRTDLIEHSIDVGNTKPIKQRHWPVSPAIEKLMFDEIEHMLSLGVIEESNSPWSSNCSCKTWE